MSTRRACACFKADRLLALQRERERGEGDQKRNAFKVPL